MKFFACLKTWFLDLNQVKFICYRHYLLLLTNKDHFWIISATYFVILFLKWPKKLYILRARKKIIKKMFEKSFSVFRGVKGTPLNTLQLCLAKCFIIFCTNHEQYIFFFIISILFRQQFADNIQKCSLLLSSIKWRR